MNPYKDVEDSSFAAAPHLTYEDIASKLLKDRHFLTALELHTELVESGKELPQLREFFSNPGNFEQHVSRATEINSMQRTPSQATLDSLDTARYSEDGGGDRRGSANDVAVLEFELRKARETINSLRANLTQFADGESVLDNRNTKDKFVQRALKPHEKRALNFLINEYLLLQDYKLTSITFSDENPDQDFEDWDDVGLNMPRPSGLISLFWGNTQNLNSPKTDCSTQIDFSAVDIECQVDEDFICCHIQQDHETDWNHELLIQAEEVELLKQKIIDLETEKLNFQKLYDAAIVSLNSLTSPTIENKSIDVNISGNNTLANVNDELPKDMQTLTSTAAENHYGSGHSTHSATPEQFEIIESDKNSTNGIMRKEGSNTSSFDPGLIDPGQDSPLHRGSVTTLDETLSINDGGEWTRVQYEYNSIECSGKDMWIDSNIPNSLKTAIMNWCIESMNEPLENDLLSELINSDKPITMSSLLNLVADTLPRIVSHTLVSRRCEAAALLAGGAALLPAGPRRARTLHALLTLLKKPEPADARAICEATCLVVKWGGSGEVLSSIAELLTSRSYERRLLASQMCATIAPYVPIELCTSLLLSLVMLMCEATEAEIRSLGLRTACLIAPVAEHKYMQIESLLFNFLNDPAEKIVNDTVNHFVPVMARTALLSGKFTTDLCNGVLKNLLKATNDNDWKHVILYLEVLKVLILGEMVYVVNVQLVKEANLSDCDNQVNLQEVPLESDSSLFVEPQCYSTDSTDIKILLLAMNALIKETPDVRWPELTWFIEFIKQILDVATNCKALNHPSVYEQVITLFSEYVENFGIHFSTNILKPIFLETIEDLEQKMEKLDSINMDRTIVVGVYLVAMLPVLQDKTHHVEFLQKWIVYSSVRGLPVKMLSIPLKWLSQHRPDDLNLYLQHIRELIATSIESTGGSTVREYVARVLTEVAGGVDDRFEAQLVPALSALLHDEQEAVCEAALALWAVMTRAAEARGAGRAARCWALADRARFSSPRLRRATATALALLVLPSPHHATVSAEAVSLVCSLCAQAHAAECVRALTPALQLAAHHAPHHPALLPALRKLEELVQGPAFSQYKSTIEALVHSVAVAVNAPQAASQAASQAAPQAASQAAPAVSHNLHAAQEVGRRVTQMFQAKTNMNLQNIFKKKT